MRVLFLTDNFPPEVNAPASRTFEHCCEWVKRGAEVTVITCVPNFPQGKVYAGYRNRLYQEEEMAGIRVIRMWSYISANEGFLKRILDYVSFACSGSLAALFIKTDVIVATSPQFFTAIGGAWAAFLKRKPWVMEVRDIWPESIRAVGAMKDGRMYRWLERLELLLYRRARRVVVVTDSFRNNLIARGIQAEKIVVIKNGVLIDQFSPQEKNIQLEEQLGLSGKFILAYFGTHGMAHGLDFIIRSAQALPSNVHILLIGDGAEKENLLKLKKERAAENVTLLPLVTKTEIARYIAVSDVALVNLRKSDTFKSVIPSKIFENAAMQKPILLGVEGESKQLVEDYQAGICFEPENELSLLEAVRHLLNKQEYERYQQGCLLLARDFDRRLLASNMLKLLMEISMEVPVKHKDQRLKDSHPFKD